MLFLFLDVTPISDEAFPTNASDARSVVGPPTLSSVEAPVDAQVRLFAVPSGPMLRTNALPYQRAFIVGRDEHLTDSSVATNEVIARIQLTVRHLVAACKSGKLRRAVANFSAVEQNATAVVEALRRRRARRLFAATTAGAGWAFAEATAVRCGDGFGCTAVETNLKLVLITFVHFCVNNLPYIVSS